MISHVKGSSDLVKVHAERRDCRILVVLHLYYPSAWPWIKKHLATFHPQKFDLIVTVTEGRCDETVIRDIHEFAPKCVVQELPDIGYDVGPFIEILRGVDLDRYDLVYKIHSKGTKARLRYIYDQVFMKDDWRENLFRGLFGSRRTHEILDLFNSDPKLGLVAAENLIVCDPVYKQNFTRRYAERLGVSLSGGYRFVAGTCFAARATALKSLQSLGLKLSDFTAAKPGEFSLAHAIERLLSVMIEESGFSIKGMPVRHPRHFFWRSVLRCLSTQRLLDQKDFVLDLDFFYRVLESRKLLWFKVVDMRLGDLRRRDETGALRDLASAMPLRYLAETNDGRAAYARYCAENQERTGFAMDPARFDALIESMAGGFDQKRMPVVVPVHGELCLMDGQHRACVLLARFGPDYHLKVLRLRLVPLHLVKRLRTMVSRLLPIAEVNVL